MPDTLDTLPACFGCGSCCHLTVEVTPGVDDVPGELTVEHEGALFMDQHGDGACVALDPVSLLCTIYERRPGVCRGFHRGETLCRVALARFGRPPLGRSASVR